jgi:hypothetical protein
MYLGRWVPGFGLGGLDEARRWRGGPFFFEVLEKRGTGPPRPI